MRGKRFPGPLPLLAAALAVVCLASCSSLSLEFQARNENVPLWVLKPEKQRGKLFFVGEGNDPDIYRATLKAYIDISGQLAKHLGAELSDERYRSLTTMGKIADFSLYIQEKATKTEADGTSTVHLLAVASKKKLDARRSQAAAELQRLASEVETKEEAAKDFLQEDRDIDAVKAYLEAAAAAMEAAGERSEADDCFQKACAILKRMEIVLSDVDGGLARAEVGVLRRNRFFSSEVVGATVRASFGAEGLDGALYQDSFVFGTNKNGRFSFVPPNDGLVKKGAVSFEIDLGGAFERYLRVAPKENGADIRALLRERAVSMDYDLVPRRAGARVLVGIAEFDIHGDRISPSDAPSATASRLAGLLSKDEVEASPFCSGEAVSAADVDLPYDYLVLGKVGLEEDFDTAPAVSLLANGVFALYKKGSEAPVFSSGMVRTSASGEEPEAVLREAFDRFAETARLRLRDVFFF